jgi:transcriptional regulator with XRE-family HTH domain
MSDRGEGVSVNTFKGLWGKLSASKKYREEFVAAQVKRGIPFQIRQMLDAKEWNQSELAERANLTQGVISRVMNPNYGNLTLNTLIRVAAGFDVAFLGHFVPFSELDRWFSKLSDVGQVLSFEDENTIVEKCGIAALPAYSSFLFREANELEKEQPEPKEFEPFCLAGATDGQNIGQITIPVPEPGPTQRSREMAAGA